MSAEEKFFREARQLLSNAMKKGSTKKIVAIMRLMLKVEMNRTHPAAGSKEKQDG